MDRHRKLVLFGVAAGALIGLATSFVFFLVLAIQLMRHMFLFGISSRRIALVFVLPALLVALGIALVAKALKRENPHTQALFGEGGMNG